MSEYVEEKEATEAKETQDLTSDSESSTTNASGEEAKKNKSTKGDVAVIKEAKRGLKRFKFSSLLLRISQPFLCFIMVLTCVSMATSIPRSTNAMPEWYHILGGAILLYGLCKFLEHHTGDMFALSGLSVSFALPLVFVGTLFVIIASGTVDAATRIFTVTSHLMLVSAAVASISIVAGLALAKDADSKGDK